MTCPPPGTPPDRPANGRQPTLQPAEVQRIYAEADLLYTAAEVENAILSMAQEISAQLAAQNPIILCLMRGAIVVTGKLLPLLDFPLQLEYVHLSRYHGTERQATPSWIRTPTIALQNRHVLIVDDILDEGITLATTIKECRNMGARSVKTAVLVDKKLPTPRNFQEADFTGLTVPDRYLFGYGMDYMEYLRNAPGIYAVKNT